jgi:hypothetical protein
MQWGQTYHPRNNYIRLVVVVLIARVTPLIVGEVQLSASPEGIQRSAFGLV